MTKETMEIYNKIKRTLMTAFRDREKQMLDMAESEALRVVIDGEKSDSCKRYYGEAKGWKDAQMILGVEMQKMYDEGDK